MFSTAENVGVQYYVKIVRVNRSEFRPSSLPQFLLGVLKALGHKVDGLEAGDGIVLHGGQRGVEGPNVGLVCQTVLRQTCIRSLLKVDHRVFDWTQSIN